MLSPQMPKLKSNPPMVTIATLHTYDVTHTSTHVSSETRTLVWMQAVFFNTGTGGWLGGGVCGVW